MSNDSPQSEQSDQPEKSQFDIPECNWHTLQEKVEKLGRRASKLGLTPPSLNVVGTYEKPIQKINELTGELYVAFYRKYFQVEVVGEAPIVPGYRLIAVIEHTNDTEIGNVVRTVPGEECPREYRQCAPYCDHCKTSRRRLETFVIVDFDGAYKKVGRNCLADFCRSPDAAKQICAWFEIIASIDGLCSGAEDDDFFGYGGRTINRAMVESVLSTTSRIIRHCGWLSRTKARELAEQEDYKQATADIVSNIFFGCDFWKVDKYTSEAHKRLQAAAKDIQPEDVELAESALAWIRAKREEVGESAENLSDYLYNLLVVLTEETVLDKHFGLACSVIATYQREMGRLETTKRESEATEKSEHFGTVGKREAWEGTILSCDFFESDYGGKYLVKFDMNGNRAIWWATNPVMMWNRVPDDARTDTLTAWIGSKVSVKGTVKKHGEFRRQKQTELSRCKLTLVEEPQ